MWPLVIAATAHPAAAHVIKSALWWGVIWFAPVFVDLDNKAQHAMVCMLACVVHTLIDVV